MQYVRAHSRESAATIIDQAYTLASEQTNDPHEWPHIFNQACDLLAAGVFVQAPPIPDGVIGDLMRVAGGR